MGFHSRHSRQVRNLPYNWFINRKMIPWPPEPLRLIASQAIRGYMRIEDALYERKMV
ncbi:MAG: hypothetical protein QMD04_00670 [Anaerolineales bacterium]|nr:hypothetical protein [Anaerolineales bacterium]